MLQRHVRHRLPPEETNRPAYLSVYFLFALRSLSSNTMTRTLTKCPDCQHAFFAESNEKICKYCVYGLLRRSSFTDQNFVLENTFSHTRRQSTIVKPCSECGLTRVEFSVGRRDCRNVCNGCRNKRQRAYSRKIYDKIRVKTP
jgi:hypothetical protein